jgi:folate-binding protein YgfZ
MSSVDSPIVAEFAHPVRLFDLSDRTQIELTGRDRATFLHNFCTNDIKKLTPGEGCEAFLTNIKGRIIGHLLIFAATESLWIDSVAGAEEFIATHLDRYLITEQVEIHRRGSERADLYLSGSGAGKMIEVTFGVAAPSGPWRTLPAGIEGFGEIQIRRMDLGASLGFLLSVPRLAAERVIERLFAAGAIRGDRNLFEAMRIGAGFPEFGVDLTDENLAQEARRTTSAISFTKGCYLGQEPIARLDALGHVNRELCIVESSSGDVPPPGSPVFASGQTAPAGQVTSSVRDPRTGRIWCLAILKTVCSAEGAAVEMGEARQPGVVHAPQLSGSPHSH